MNSMWVEKVRTWAVGLMVVTAVGGGIGGYAVGPATGQSNKPTIATAQAADPPAPKRENPNIITEIEKAGKAVLQGQMDEAYIHLLEAVKNHPNLPPARVMLVRLYLAAQRQPKDAKQLRAILEQAVIENPDHPLVYLELGNVALSEGRNTEALLDGQMALELSTAARWTANQKKDVQTQAWSILATAHEARGEWAASRDQLVKLLDESPKNGRLRQRLARTLIGLGKPDDAYRELARATKDEPSLGWPTVGMATLYAEAKDVKKAREWFDKAVQEQPESFQAHSTYARWLVEQKELPDAKHHTEKAAKLRPNSAEVRRLQDLIAEAERPAKVEPPIRP